MIAALAIGQDSTRKSLQAWGAYLVRLHSETTAVKRVTLESADASVQSLKTPGVVELEQPATLHSPTCRCSLCSGLSTSGTAISGTGVVEVNLTGELSEEDQDVIEKLKQRDAEVRSHEQAHLAVAGHHAMGGPSYTYQVGPDGQRYAIGGSVQIDLSPVPNDPEATLRKAQQLRQAALAPSSPSSTDRQVASMASRMAQDALKDIAEESRPANKEGKNVKGRKDSSDHNSNETKPAGVDAQSDNSSSTTESADGPTKANDSGDLSMMGGAREIAPTTLSGDGVPSPKTSTLAAAAFASSVADTGLDIYV